MKLTAFISHSSQQKAFATSVVSALGKNKCFIDCFDFQPAYRTLDEIYRLIGESGLFILLISKDAIGSDWVQKEIAIAQDLLKSGELARFVPYVIDPDINIVDVPEWIRKEECYNLKLFNSPGLLALDIERKQRHLLWSYRKDLKQINEIFVGRNDKIDEFQRKMFSAQGNNIKTLITSGRDGVGRAKFAMKCIAELPHYTSDISPCKICIDATNSIEDLIINLNDVLRIYNIEQLTNMLSQSIQSKLDLAISLINGIYSVNSILVIEDNYGCITPKRNFSDWFRDIICDPSLDNKLGIFLLSKVALSPKIEQEYYEAINIQLHPLSENDRYLMFYRYAQAFNLSISKNDAEFFVGKLLGSPEQIVRAINIIKDCGLNAAKRDINDIVDLGDKKVIPTINYFRSDAFATNLLILLSKLGVVSYHVLEGIYKEQYDDVLKKMAEFSMLSIIEEFGPSDMYVKLDNALSDYIQRNKIPLDKDIELSMKDALSKMVTSSDNDDDLEDLSLYLYNIKNQLLEGIGRKECYLIPSIIMRTIVELNREKNWDGVISICDKILENRHKYYESIVQDILFNLCSALCRNNNHRFFNEIKRINDPMSVKFLKAFYYRNDSDYKQAELLYREILAEIPNMNRASREMVIVLLNQSKYQEAKVLAKTNYERTPNNSYHVYAYFRCLVKDPHTTKDDITTLNKLIGIIKNGHSPHKDSRIAAMQAEYLYYIDHDVAGAIKTVENAIRFDSESYDLLRVENEIKLKQGFRVNQGQYKEMELD